MVDWPRWAMERGSGSRCRRTGSTDICSESPHFVFIRFLFFVCSFTSWLSGLTLTLFDWIKKTDVHRCISLVVVLCSPFFLLFFRHSSSVFFLYFLVLSVPVFDFTRNVQWACPLHVMSLRGFLLATCGIYHWCVVATCGSC